MLTLRKLISIPFWNSKKRQFQQLIFFVEKFKQFLNHPEVAKKKSRKTDIDPEYLKKQKEALVRRHRQVIYLNDSEMAAIRQYCDRFRVGTKAVLFREAIMEKVLSELDDNHPTLF